MAKAEVLSAKAQFDRATLDFNRINDLYRKNTSTKSDFDSSKAAYEVAAAQLESAQARATQARLNLDYASIKAPFDGRISDTPYSEGSLLGPESGVLATVVSTDPVLAVFGLPSRAAAEIFQRDDSWYGADWLARLKLAPDVYYPGAGRLVYLSPTVDAQTDTVKLKARFDNPDDVLRPGQIVTAVLESAQPRRRLLVPKAAVLTDPEGRYVLTVREPQKGAGLVAERRPVVLDQGELDREYFIREGLEAGDKFIIKGLMSGGATLRPGTPVRLAPPEGGPGPAGGGGG
jgi:membrane fusion protein (multidrug efflux system)